MGLLSRVPEKWGFVGVAAVVVTAFLAAAALLIGVLTIIVSIVSATFNLAP